MITSTDSGTVDTEHPAKILQACHPGAPALNNGVPIAEQTGRARIIEILHGLANIEIEGLGKVFHPFCASCLAGLFRNLPSNAAPFAVQMLR